MLETLVHTPEMNTQNHSTCMLSININKIATLRNSRGGQLPDPIQCAKDLITYGAQGITVHPRPDERHIRYQDVYDLKKLLTRYKNIEFNIEGYPNKKFLKLIHATRPDQVTLVPDPPNALTSNAGWKIKKNIKLLKKVVKDIHKTGARVSLFIDVFNFTNQDLLALQEIGAERVELYTERYATDFNTKKRKHTTDQYARIAHKVSASGIKINAGHDLNLENVGYLLKKVPTIAECSIGHAFISEALYFGFQKTLKNYLQIMSRARQKTKMLSLQKSKTPRRKR